jgi:DivIVA domain-containing protein
MRDDLRAYEVQEMVFSKPPMGKRGYNEDEVDAFLEDAEATIARMDRRR